MRKLEMPLRNMRSLIVLPKDAASPKITNKPSLGIKRPQPKVTNKLATIMDCRLLMEQALKKMKLKDSPG